MGRIRNNPEGEKGRVKLALTRLRGMKTGPSSVVR